MKLESAGLLSRIRKGEAFFEFQKEALAVFAPLEIGRSATPWSVNILIPKSRIMENARKLMWKLNIEQGVSLLRLWTNRWKHRLNFLVYPTG